MNEKQMEQHFKDFLEIMSGKKQGNKDALLKKLNEEAGASTQMYQAAPANADLTELAKNFCELIQTGAMVNMCKSAAKNYKIAFVAAITAALSAFAAWTAVFVSM
ncbi:hypothetical protein ES703_110648 [subsurface metagenome]